jgi:hypothetical protein
VTPSREAVCRAHGPTPLGPADFLCGKPMQEDGVRPLPDVIEFEGGSVLPGQASENPAEIELKRGRQAGLQGENRNPARPFTLGGRRSCQRNGQQKKVKQLPHISV